MALDPILWAQKDAPVANIEEWAVLSVMAESADEDGCNAFQATQTIADRIKLSKRTVQRRIDDMLERHLISLGDQNHWRLMRIPGRYRPVNYDLLIPYSWFGNIDRVQAYRTQQGLAPLTRQERPDLGPAPEKKRRADAGKTRAKSEEGSTVTPLRTHSDEPGSARDDYKSPLSRGDYKSPLEHGRGDYQTQSGVTTSHAQGRTAVTQPSPITLPGEPTPERLLLNADASSETEEPTFDLVMADASAAPAVTFDDFWAVYPRHVEKARAEKAWNAAIKKADPAHILAGARRFANDPNLPPKAEAKFIKHPATWLTAGCWDDEPLPPRLSNVRAVRSTYDDEQTWGTEAERLAAAAAQRGLSEEEMDALVEAQYVDDGRRRPRGNLNW